MAKGHSQRVLLYFGENNTLIRFTRSSILSLLSRPSAVTAACIAALLAVNIFICRELFTSEYLRNMGSIECTHIAISRWIMEHPWDLKWFPLWYGGVPFQNAYTPLLHISGCRRGEVAQHYPRALLSLNNGGCLLPGASDAFLVLMDTLAQQVAQLSGGITILGVITLGVSQSRH